MIKSLVNRTRRKLEVCISWFTTWAGLRWNEEERKYCRALRVRAKRPAGTDVVISLLKHFTPHTFTSIMNVHYSCSGTEPLRFTSVRRHLSVEKNAARSLQLPTYSASFRVTEQFWHTFITGVLDSFQRFRNSCDLISHQPTLGTWYNLHSPQSLRVHSTSFREIKTVRVRSHSASFSETEPFRILSSD